MGDALEKEGLLTRVLADEIDKETPRKDAQGFPVVEPPKEKTDSKERPSKGERKDQAPLRRFG